MTIVLPANSQLGIRGKSSSYINDSRSFHKARVTASSSSREVNSPLLEQGLSADDTSHDTDDDKNNADAGRQTVIICWR